MLRLTPSGAGKLSRLRGRFLAAAQLPLHALHVLQHQQVAKVGLLLAAVMCAAVCAAKQPVPQTRCTKQLVGAVPGAGTLGCHRWQPQPPAAPILGWDEVCSCLANTDTPCRAAQTLEGGFTTAGLHVHGLQDAAITARADGISMVPVWRKIYCCHVVLTCSLRHALTWKLSELLLIVLLDSLAVQSQRQTGPSS